MSFFLPELYFPKDEFLDRDHSILPNAIIWDVYASAAIFSSLQLKAVCVVYLHCLCGGPRCGLLLSIYRVGRFRENMGGLAFNANRSNSLQPYSMHTHLNLVCCQN